MEPTHSILLCEEDAAARAFLADLNLIADGYDVITADCKPAALAKLPASRTRRGDLRHQRRHPRPCSTPSGQPTASPRASTPTCR